MQVVQHCTVREVGKPTLKQAINEKMRVLREFYAVDERNDTKVRQLLEAAVRESPNRDYEIVLDHIARRLIFEKLNRGE